MYSKGWAGSFTKDNKKPDLSIMKANLKMERDQARALNSIKLAKLNQANG